MERASRTGNNRARFSVSPRVPFSQASSPFHFGFAEGDDDVVQPLFPLEAGLMRQRQSTAAEDLKKFAAAHQFATILADPPWRFMNRTGKMAPEHRRLSRYGTMSADDIAALPVSQLAAPTAHLYLWVPNALVPEGLKVMEAWGFQYKTNIVWHKLRKDGGSDGRGVGFHFRNVTELILFGVA